MKKEVYKIYSYDESGEIFSSSIVSESFNAVLRHQLDTDCGNRWAFIHHPKSGASMYNLEKINDPIQFYMGVQIMEYVTKFN